MENFNTAGKHSPEQLEESLRLIRELLKSMGIPHLLLAGFPASNGKLCIASKCDATDDELVQLFRGLLTGNAEGFESVKAAIRQAEGDPVAVLAMKLASKVKHFGDGK